MPRLSGSRQNEGLGAAGIGLLEELFAMHEFRSGVRRAASILEYCYPDFAAPHVQLLACTTSVVVARKAGHLLTTWH